MKYVPLFIIAIVVVVSGVINYKNSPDKKEFFNNFGMKIFKSAIILAIVLVIISFL